MCIFEPRPQRGTTLIELIVFIVVVSVGLAGVLAVFNVVVRSSADPMIAKQALAVAEATMEEVLLKNFCDPDLAPPACAPSVEGARALFDDVQDYNSAAFQDAADITGPIFSPANAYQTQVVVTQPGVAPEPAMPGAAGAGVVAGDVYRVVVTVRAPDGVNYALTGYRYNYE